MTKREMKEKTMQTIYTTRDREAGNVIESFDTKEEALQAIAEYEEQDKKEGTYTENFYEVAEDGSVIEDYKDSIKERNEAITNRLRISRADTEALMDALQVMANSDMLDEMYDIDMDLQDLVAKAKAILKM